jgi:hypothetical protein
VTLADWLVVSVTLHYVAIGVIYAREQHSWLFLGLYWSYALANVFLICIAQTLAKRLK